LQYDVGHPSMGMMVFVRANYGYKIL
jgi:hypothetical protein